MLEVISISERDRIMDNLITATEKLREELETLVALKGIGHGEVLKLSQRLDKYILMHYLKKN